MPRDPEDPRSDEDMQAQHAADVAWAAEPRVHSGQTWWRDLPATAKQNAFLSKHGRVVVKTRGEASDAIKAIIDDDRRQYTRWGWANFRRVLNGWSW